MSRILMVNHHTEIVGGGELSMLQLMDELGRNAAVRAKCEYSWKTAAEMTRSFYLELMAHYQEDTQADRGA
ncbi:MAG: hypothetical protein RQ867_01985 [Mariprofundaceae bacterium]|nr:hypothetical protein [Mariprofundaceae bacterium]